MKRIHKDRPLTKQERLERNAARRRVKPNIDARIEAIGLREDARKAEGNSNLFRDWNILKVHRSKKVG